MTPHIIAILCSLCIISRSDVPLPTSPLHEPKIIVPLKDCSTLRLTEVGVIVLVPIVDDPNLEWILFVRHDNTIWDYDIPPTPYSTVQQYHPTQSYVDSDFYGTVIYKVPIDSPPCFCHLVIRLINKQDQSQNLSFGSTSIVLRITNLQNDDEVQNIHSLYRNALRHSESKKWEQYRLHSQYNDVRSMNGISIKRWNDEYLGKFSSNDSLSKSLYKIDGVFTDEFLNQILSDISAAKVDSTGFTTPNTMNSDGFVLHELGYGPLFQEFMKKWIVPITSRIYPFYLWCGGDLDEIHGFTIRFTAETDRGDVVYREASRHMDQSQITFNLCLKNEDPIGSQVRFSNVRGEEDGIGDGDGDVQEVVVSMERNSAVIHVGQQWHSTDMIQSGERVNLILWFRSDYCRNSITEYAFQKCPNFKPSDVETNGHSEL